MGTDGMIEVHDSDEELENTDSDTEEAQQNKLGNTVEKGMDVMHLRVLSFGAQDRKTTMHWFLDTKDACSTGNMQKHVRACSCWGEAALTAADSAANADEVCTKIVGGILKNGLITEAFEQKGKGKRTYPNWPLTRSEIKVEIVRWVCIRVWPFDVVGDEEFHFLMKLGWVDMYIPSPSTVSQDVQLVFIKTCQRIANMLNAYAGHLSFTTDAWTLPNHRAYVAVSVHLEKKGVPFLTILDIIKVAELHSGANLATALKRVFEEFKISEKLLCITCDNASTNNKMIDELQTMLPEYAKSLISMFDIKKKKNGPSLEDLKSVDGLEKEIEELSENMDQEAQAMVAETEGSNVNEEADDTTGLVNIVEEMGPEERATHEGHVRPVTLVLVKLRKLAFKIINSTTNLLPAWYDVLACLKLLSKLCCDTSQ
ncbi:hypothetical protein AX14_005280 [Amanita brunnescens Koide BX004]|nr:hypothetical protein AX14_005280 [Amanita brunnescens Koide BX004]